MELQVRGVKASVSSIHCCETFSPRSFDQALRDYAPTWLTAAPALHIAMKDYYAGQNSTPSIRTLRCFRSSSAPLAPASIARLEELYAAPLLETYELTETASTLCSNGLPPGKRKPGSVGQAINADLKIVDPEERELPAGQDGEVILKGPGVISEYSELSRRTRLSTATCAPATSDASTETVICTSLVD
jgi:acyl-CoA synthetase (AMP-forming)/AMP-acid ligase II